MLLADAYTEFVLAHDYQPATRRYYRERLGRFIRWCEAQGVTTTDGLSAPLVRRYLDERKTLPSEKTGRPLDSYTPHPTNLVLLLPSRTGSYVWCVADARCAPCLPAPAGALHASADTARPSAPSPALPFPV